MSKITNTTCVLPWIHFSLKPNGDIKPCCRFVTYHDDETSAQYLNFNVSNYNNATDVLKSTQFENIRQKMLNGDRISGCKKCYMEEEIHGSSMRHGVNEEYDVESVVGENQLGLQFLEVGFGNYCNLACRSCGADLSTSWFEDDRVLSKYYDRDIQTKIKNSKFLWKSDDFKTVTYIKFTGGEPMLHPNFIKFLDVIISGGHHTHITLEVFTNCSWDPKDKILNRLKKFQNVKIYLSVDGMGEVNNYIRHYSNWETVERSLLTWLTLEKTTINFSLILTPTISIYNIFDIKDLLFYWKKIRTDVGLELTRENGNIIANIVTYPEYISLQLLPDKDQIIKELELYTNNKEIYTIPLERIVEVLKSKNKVNHTLEYFLNYTADLDKLRNQSLENSIPKLWNYLNNYFNKISVDIKDFKGKINE